MPELPEVETVKRGLERLVVSKTIKHVHHKADKSFPNDQYLVDEFMLGATISKVTRRAKVLLIELSSTYTIMVHLKMTGQLVFVGDTSRWGAGHPNDSLVDNLPDKSTRVHIEFDDGSILYFNDQRRFGWVKLLPNHAVELEPFMQKVGPEPFDPAFTPSVFIERVRRRNGTTIKAAILDQTVLAGVGNIYADESLWSTMIHPAERVRNISDAKLRELHGAIIAVMQLSIDKGGSTNKNYVDAEGKRGSYMEFANVFRREGQACTRCSTIIEKLRVAGRGTHICPHCQVQLEHKDN